MGDYAQRIEAAGIRHITVKLTRGDVAFARVDGDAILIDSDDPIAVERYDDIVQIGPRLAGRGITRGLRDRVRAEMRLGGSFAEFGAQLSDLGTQISEAVSMAMESLSGVAGADVRIGIPAVLERPTIDVMTGSGDLRADEITAAWSLKTGFGDIEAHRCGGSLTTQSGKGDIEIQRFAGMVSAVTGAGDLEAHAIEARVELRTGAGDITIDGCPAGGALHSGSGDVEAEDVGGTWQIRTGSGDVTMRIASAASLEITTGSGDIEVEGGALHRLRVHTSSGDVKCASLLIGSRHEILSGHGDVELALADPPGARLQIITGHGDVSSVFPLVRVGKQGPQSHGSARYVGNVGDSTIDVELRTSSGDIMITRLEPDEALRAMAREARMEEAVEPAAGSPEAGPIQAPEAPVAPVPPMPPIPPIAPIPPIPPIPPVPPVRASDVPAGEQGSGEASPAAEGSPDAGVTESAPTEEPSAADSRLRVLQSLQRGEISVEEASSLLQALG